MQRHVRAAITHTLLLTGAAIVGAIIGLTLGEALTRI